MARRRSPAWAVREKVLLLIEKPFTDPGTIAQVGQLLAGSESAFGRLRPCDG